MRVAAKTLLRSPVKRASAKVEITLDAAQCLIIDEMFISQANNRLAFNSQGVMLQSLVLRRDDLTAAIFWIFNTKLQAVAEK